MKPRPLPSASFEQERWLTAIDAAVIGRDLALSNLADNLLDCHGESHRHLADAVRRIIAERSQRRR